LAHQKEPGVIGFRKEHAVSRTHAIRASIGLRHHSMNDSYGSQIKEWDWHYRVGFDEELAERVNRELLKAKGDEGSAAERHELDFYKKLISVDCLINQCINKPVQAEKFLECCTQKSVLYLPLECAEKISNRLRQCQSISQNQLKGLQELIARASKAEFVNYSKHLLELALGNGFLSTAKSHLTGWRDVKQPNHPIWPGGSLESPDLILEKYSKSALAYGKRLLGSEEVEDPIWKLRFSDEVSCFAEYWPSLITGVKDELLIGEALVNTDRADVIGTLIHEIAGHACFYKLASTGYFSFLDHGATCMIEGWATWCEWNSPFSIPEYTFKLRQVAIRNLGLSELGSPSDANAEIKSLMTEIGGSPNLAEQGMINFYQYPGYSMSYFAGAAWFDLKFQEIPPDSYWKSREGTAITNVLDPTV